MGKRRRENADPQMQEFGAATAKDSLPASVGERSHFFIRDRSLTAATKCRRRVFPRRT
jgi:hypothetical protein